MKEGPYKVMKQSHPVAAAEKTFELVEVVFLDEEELELDVGGFEVVDFTSVVDVDVVPVRH